MEKENSILTSFSQQCTRLHDDLVEGIWFCFFWLFLSLSHSLSLHFSWFLYCFNLGFVDDWREKQTRKKTQQQYKYLVRKAQTVFIWRSHIIGYWLIDGYYGVSHQTLYILHGIYSLRQSFYDHQYNKIWYFIGKDVQATEQQAKILDISVLFVV